MPCCDCQTNPRLRDTPGWNGGGYDGGIGYYEGQRVHWEYHKDGDHKINIFPQGPYQRHHDHIVVEHAQVVKVFGEYHIQGGREVFRRVNGNVVINIR